MWRLSVGIERVSRDETYFGPADSAIQLHRRTVLLGVECQERKARLPGGVFNGLHQSSAQAVAAAAAMDDEFRNVCAMRLVRRPRGMHLDGPNDSIAIARDKENGTALDRRERSPPPLFGALDCERRKKTDRGAGIHRIDKKFAECSDVTVAYGWNQSFDHGRLCRT